jgi:hypothetical protein
VPITLPEVSAGSLAVGAGNVVSFLLDTVGMGQPVPLDPGRDRLTSHDDQAAHKPFKKG